MTDTEKQNIINYAAPPVSVMIVGAVFTALSPVGFLIARAISDELWRAGVVGGVMAVMGIVFMCLRFYYAAAAKKAIKNAQANASEEFLVYDFRNGRKFLSDRIICGEHYVFSKGLGMIVRLSDIVELRRETKYYRSVPTAENLSVKTKDGKRTTLCSISAAEGTPPLSDIIREIIKQAPDVEFIDKRL